MLERIRRSIRLKVTFLVLATVLAALLCTGTILVLYDLRQHRESWVTDLVTQAEIVGRASAPALAFHDTLTARQNLALLSVRPHIEHAAIFTPDGHRFATYTRKGSDPGDIPARPIEDGYRTSGAQIVLQYPVRDSDERLGSIYLRAEDDVLARLASYLATVGLVLVISLLVALALSSLLQNAVTRPILAIAEVAQRVKAERNFGLRARKTTDDETGELVVAFNSMLSEVGQRTTALEESNRALQREMGVRQEAERALRDANRRKDEFLATLAHELRNPLAPIRNAVHYINARGASDPRAAELIPIIDRQVQHMVRLIDDLMDISRITRDKLELRLSEFGLDDLLREVVEACGHALSEAGHSIVVRPVPPGVVLRADRARLDQVLGNLLNNAIKYTPPGGHIELEAEVEGRELVLFIRDDGIGIPREQLEQIFEPFSQLDRSLEKARGGLGIGLALSRRLVQLHAGTVTVDSPGQGRGTTFRVCLPIVIAPGVTEVPDVPEAGPAAEAPAPRPAPAEAGAPAISAPRAMATAPPEAAATPGRMRVLVADDNKDAAETLASLLRAAGHEAATAYDGEQALALLDRGPFEVGVIDIGMPRLNGYDVAEQVRRGAKGAHLRLVALTGWGQTEDRRRALAAGFDDHLTKPVHPEALLSLLESYEASKGRATG
jgi:signal transduction histidine kinase/ActR/RegA family two-component response regulator